MSHFSLVRVITYSYQALHTSGNITEVRRPSKRFLVVHYYHPRALARCSSIHYTIWVQMERLSLFIVTIAPRVHSRVLCHPGAVAKSAAAVSAPRPSRTSAAAPPPVVRAGNVTSTATADAATDERRVCTRGVPTIVALPLSGMMITATVTAAPPGSSSSAGRLRNCTLCVVVAGGAAPPWWVPGPQKDTASLALSLLPALTPSSSDRIANLPPSSSPPPPPPLLPVEAPHALLLLAWS